MNLFADVAHWWSGGDLLMPVMLLVALALFALLGERAWLLWGPEVGRQRRLAELTRLVAGHPDRAWAARYLAVAEEEQFSRGFLLIRTLTLVLPLLGLLGTVSGMVDTFSSLATGRAAMAAQDASRGIGLALTATQYGMALAIPGMLGEWLLRQRVHALVSHRDGTTCGAVAAEDVTAVGLEELRCSA